MEQWEFYVLPTYILNNEKGNQSSISLNPLRKLVKSCDYENLQNEINKAYQKQLKHKE